MSEGKFPTSAENDTVAHVVSGRCIKLPHVVRGDIQATRATVCILIAESFAVSVRQGEKRAAEAVRVAHPLRQAGNQTVVIRLADGFGNARLRSVGICIL